METIETLGKYEIKGTLGRGAMGTVYEGWDPVIARRVAIKTVKIPEVEDPETEEQLARFRREAQAAGRLIHPNIVGVFDYGETSNLAYIVMEFVDGPPVKALLDKRERFAVPDVLRLMDDLLTGLQFSHERGVVHRDIKPANIMLTSEGQAKIADFGIARIESSSMTQAGTVLGTPAYMSPEQFMGQVVDKRSDIYSSGVVLYQLLTGERPFEGGLSAIMHKALNTEPPWPSQIAITSPPAFDTVVRKAMAKRPEDRFQSATEFLQALKAAAAGGRDAEAAYPADEATMVAAAGTIIQPPAPQPPHPRTAEPATPASAPPAPAPAGKSRLPALIAALLVVLLAAGGGAWFFLSPGATAKHPAATSAPARTATSTPAIPATPQHTASATPAGAAGGKPASATPEAAPQARQAQVQPAPSTPAAGTSQPPLPTTQQAQANKAPAAAPPAPPQNTGTQPSIPAPAQSASSQAAATPIAPAGSSGGNQQLAATSLQAVRQQIHRMLAAQKCSALAGTVQDSGTIVLSGFAGTTAADSIREALAGRPLDWLVTSVEPYYCPALDVVHPIALTTGPLAAQLRLSLAGGITRLHDGQRILPRIVMPNFRGYLRVEYVAHDGGVMHLYPQVADPADKIAADPPHSFAPGSVVKLGEVSPGHPAWEVGPPYGTDMIIAIASSKPLFDRPRPSDQEATKGFLRQLQQAVDAARQRGERVVGSAMTVDTLPK